MLTSDYTISRNPRTADLVGQRFGRLTVCAFAGYTSIDHSATWLCFCDCRRLVVILAHNLRMANGTKSCGCLHREITRRRSRTHGQTRTSEYKIWSGIIQRCTNPHVLSYKDYGGRGIYICERWRTSFECFLADMGARPAPKYTVGRLDNEKGYNPENCAWETMKSQTRNYRRNRMLTFQGQTLCMKDWAERKGLKYGCLKSRLDDGWSVERALTEPVHKP